MKKICMVVHAYYPADETRVRREAEALVDNGCEVDILCLRDRQEKPFEIVNRVKIYRMPVRRHQGSRLVVYIFEYLSFILLSSIMLTLNFVKKRYNVVQAHNLPDFLVFAAFIPKLLGSKAILDIHDISPELFMSKQELKFENFIVKILKFLEKLSISFADYVITVGKPFAEILWKRNRLDRKLSIIMNSADPKLFDSSKYPRQNEHIKKRKLIVMYHGSLFKRYGIDVAVKAIYLLKDKLPDARFKIYGRGEAFDGLRELISDFSLDNYVDLAGYLPVDDIPLLISNADIGIVPYRKDRFTDLLFPTKIFEYIVMSKPVIVSRIATVESIFDDSAVMFFEPDNEQDLARCILELYHNPKKRDELVHIAKKQYEKISWPVMSRRYCELIASLAK